MITTEIKESIDKSVLCWLATSSKEQVPNVSPKEIFTYSGNTSLLIAHIASPESVKNIRANPYVCVSFIDVFVQKGFKIKGKARIIGKEHPSFSEMLAPLRKLAGEKIPISAVIEIAVTSVQTIIAPTYRLFPELSEEEQKASAMKTYGVRPEEHHVTKETTEMDNR